jgi:hypothetical protein
MPSNSLAATLPGSAALAASESPLVDEQDSLALMTFIARLTWPQASVAEPLAQAHKRLGGGAGAAILFALLEHEQEHP